MHMKCNGEYICCFVLIVQNNQLQQFMLLSSSRTVNLLCASRLQGKKVQVNLEPHIQRVLQILFKQDLQRQQDINYLRNVFSFLFFHAFGHDFLFYFEELTSHFLVSFYGQCSFLLYRSGFLLCVLLFSFALTLLGSLYVLVFPVYLFIVFVIFFPNCVESCFTS